MITNDWNGRLWLKKTGFEWTRLKKTGCDWTRLNMLENDWQWVGKTQNVWQWMSMTGWLKTTIKIKMTVWLKMAENACKLQQMSMWLQNNRKLQTGWLKTE